MNKPPRAKESQRQRRFHVQLSVRWRPLTHRVGLSLESRADGGELLYWPARSGEISKLRAGFFFTSAFSCWYTRSREPSESAAASERIAARARKDRPISLLSWKATGTPLSMAGAMAW